MSILDDEIILKVENAEKNLRAIIDITAGEIYQAVEDGDNKTRGYIDTKADEIIAQVDDMARELTGLIDVQAGAVTALVEGGGAAGEMSLSLNLPVIIDATTRGKLVAASTEEKVAAVYAQLEGTSGAGIRYAIKGNASNAAVKALWDDAVAGALIASQIDLSATQINVAAEHVVITGQGSTQGQTIIDGGYLRTALIDVENILTKNITVKDKGVLRSANYNGTIDANGNITAYGSTGWAIDHAGKSDFVNMRALNAQIKGSLESENFDPNSKTDGYKFYHDGEFARGIVPMLETYQIKSTFKDTPVIFPSRGIASKEFIRHTFSMSRYRDWGAIFARLGLETGRESTDGYILCDGVINNKNVHYLAIINSSSASSITAYGYNGSTLNIINESFTYGNYPTASVDIIF